MNIKKEKGEGGSTEFTSKTSVASMKLETKKKRDDAIE